jgi:hypothetical protein
MYNFQFAWAVSRGGKWDYKRQGEQYEDFGNYHFAVVAKAAGYPEWEIRRAAGAYQKWSGTSKEEWGQPWGEAPYGDEPRDQRWIDEGIRDWNRGYWKHAQYPGFACPR